MLILYSCSVYSVCINMSMNAILYLLLQVASAVLIAVGTYAKVAKEKGHLTNISINTH